MAHLRGHLAVGHRVVIKNSPTGIREAPLVSIGLVVIVRLGYGHGVDPPAILVIVPVALHVAARGSTVLLVLRRGLPAPASARSKWQQRRGRRVVES